MGVPTFFKWLSERYPTINQTVNQGVKPQIDCLYLDMNGIVHNATHNNSDTDLSNVSYQEMFLQIFQYIEALIDLSSPQKLVYMALDGVAPRAKINQQRQRRFRAGQDFQELYEKLVFDGASEEELATFASRFDRNAITPGTEFMDMLNAHIQYFIRKRMDTDLRWRQIQVIFSGSDVSGEGEHKIMQYIRHQRMQPGYDPNLRHCIYGLDADLIMLGLVSHEHNLVLLREEVTFGVQNSRQLQHKQLLKPGQFQLLHLSMIREYIDLEFNFALDADWYDLDRMIDDFILIFFLSGNDFLPHIPTISIPLGSLDTVLAIYRDHIVSSLGGYLTHYGAIDFEKLLHFLQLLSLQEEDMLRLVNQDLARILEFSKEEADSALAQAVNGVSDSKSNSQRKSTKARAPNPEEEFLTKTSEALGVERLQTPETLMKTALQETNCSPEEAANKVAVFLTEQSRSLLIEDPYAIKPLSPSADSIADLFEDSSDSEIVCLSSAPSSVNDSTVVSEFDSLLSQGLVVDHTTGEQVPLLGDINHANYYARRMPEVARAGPEGIHQLCIDFIEGLCWVYKYYYSGVPSWNWQFPHYHAPLLAHLAQVTLDECVFKFELGKPFSPMQQLMSVLPPQSASLLPSCLRPLMLTDSSPIIDFYPQKSNVNMEGCRFAYQGIIEIPFIDESRLIKAIDDAVPNFQAWGKDFSSSDPSTLLSRVDQRRNMNAEGALLFRYKLNHAQDYTVADGFTTVLQLTGLVRADDLETCSSPLDESTRFHPYFPKLVNSPVECLLYINPDIPDTPAHFFSPWGSFTDAAGTPDAAPNAEFSLITQRLLDNPFVLTQYNDTIKSVWEYSKQLDARHIRGEVVTLPKYLPLRHLLSQQPLPGFPTLKTILNSFTPADPNEAPGDGAKSNSQVIAQEKSAPMQTNLFDLRPPGDGQSPAVVLRRPPVMLFGKQSYKPSLCIAFNHDTHKSLFNAQYLQESIQNDGLNTSPLHPSTLNASTGVFKTNNYSVNVIATRFPPNRIVWCDWPFLRPGRVEWVSDGETIALPVDSCDRSRVVDRTTLFDVCKPDYAQSQMYNSEHTALLAKYTHVFGLLTDPAKSKVIIAIAPLVGMTTAPDGSTIPQWDSTYTSRRNTLQVTQNRTTRRFGNLNALPGIIFNSPLLVWNFPPLLPDPRFFRRDPLPIDECFSPGVAVAAINQEDYARFGLVKSYHPVENAIDINWQFAAPQYRGPSLFDAQVQKTNWIHAADIAKRLRITGYTLSRLTASLFLNLGRETVNIGLQLRAPRQHFHLSDFSRFVPNSRPRDRQPLGPEYSTDGGDMWQYSVESALLLKEYQNKFPELFQFLDNEPETHLNSTIHPRLVIWQGYLIKRDTTPDYKMPYESAFDIPESICTSYMQNLSSWIEQLGLSSMIMVSTTSQQLSVSSCRAFENIVIEAIDTTDDTPQVEEVRNWLKNGDQPKNSSAVSTLPISEVILPQSASGYVDPLSTIPLSLLQSNQNDQKGLFNLCDRVVISRADCSVPVGSIGTIIGLHTEFSALSDKEAQKRSLSSASTDSLFVEILLDVPYVSATRLRGRLTTPRGIIVQANKILNLSAPAWQTLAAVKSQMDMIQSAVGTVKKRQNQSNRYGQQQQQNSHYDQSRQSYQPRSQQPPRQQQQTHQQQPRYQQQQQQQQPRYQQQQQQPRQQQHQQNQQQQPSQRPTLIASSHVAIKAPTTEAAPARVPTVQAATAPVQIVQAPTIQAPTVQAVTAPVRVVQASTVPISAVPVAAPAKPAADLSLEELFNEFD